MKQIDNYHFFVDIWSSQEQFPKYKHLYLIQNIILLSSIKSMVYFTSIYFYQIKNRVVFSQNKTLFYWVLNSSKKTTDEYFNKNNHNFKQNNHILLYFFSLRSIAKSIENKKGRCLHSGLQFIWINCLVIRLCNLYIHFFTFDRSTFHTVQYSVCKFFRNVNKRVFVKDVNLT